MSSQHCICICCSIICTAMHQTFDKHAINEIFTLTIQQMFFFANCEIVFPISGVYNMQLAEWPVVFPVIPGSGKKPDCIQAMPPLTPPSPLPLPIPSHPLWPSLHHISFVSNVSNVKQSFHLVSIANKMSSISSTEQSGRKYHQIFISFMERLVV